MQKYIVEIDNKGTVEWYDFETKFRHRTDGPAIELSDGYKEWRFKGKCHRTDGPAIESVNGYKEWRFEGELHRTDGPAIEYANGNKEWWFNGKRHRTDGPAVEWSGDSKEWWIDGTRYTEEEFNKRTNSCEGKTVEIDGKKYKLTLCE